MREESLTDYSQVTSANSARALLTYWQSKYSWWQEVLQVLVIIKTMNYHIIIVHYYAMHYLHALKTDSNCLTKIPLHYVSLT